MRHLPQRLLVFLVRAYRLLLSPWLGSGCRFEPTCSAYAQEALERHGALAGSFLATGRLLRCHPGCAGGHDPVPADRPAWLAGKHEKRRDCEPAEAAPARSSFEITP
jgi:hypothetical protein